MNMLLRFSAIALLCLLWAMPAGAQDLYYWTLQTGPDYVNNFMNWDRFEVPGDDENSDDVVYVSAPGEMLIDDTHLFNGRISELYVGDSLNDTIVTQSGGTVVLKRFDIGRGFGDTTMSTYNLTGGAIEQYATSWITFGSDGSEGAFHMSGGTVENPTALNLLDGNQFRVGYGANATGAFTMTGNSTANLGRWLRLGDGENATGTITMSGDSYAEIHDVGTDSSYIGRGVGATGLFEMSGNAEAYFDSSKIFFLATNGADGNRATGTINLSGNANLSVLTQFNVCHNDYNTGTINVSGSAQMTSGTIYLGVSGANSTATMNVSTGSEPGATGGHFTTTGQLVMGRDLAHTTVNLSETGTITVGNYVRFGDGGGTATLNLDGGTLECDEILTEDGDETNGTTNATLNFNGGVLKATGANENFIDAHETYTNQILNVKTGGAIIDTNSFDVGIPRPLVGDSVSTGGGLTKMGDGALTLGGDCTYTGDTLVQAGGLRVTGSLTSDVTTSFMTTLSGTGTITGDVTVGDTFMVYYNSDADTVDRLTVDGLLDLSGGAIQFVDQGIDTLDGTAFVLATYNTWGGDPVGNPIGLPTGWSIDYDYNGNSVAIVSSTTPPPGDADGDGDVDADDARRLAAHWLQTGVDWADGDFNDDDIVDDLDASILAANWNPPAEGVGVPEPGSIALLLGLIAGAALWRRIKR